VYGRTYLRIATETRSIQMSQSLERPPFAWTFIRKVNSSFLLPQHAGTGASPRFQFRSVICPSENVVELLLLFEPGNGIWEPINSASEQLVKHKENVNRYISVSNIEGHVYPEKPTIVTAMLCAEMPQDGAIVKHELSG
jgi:hypothetical protein